MGVIREVVYGTKKNTLGISSSSVSADVNWEETKNSENFDATMHVFKSDATNLIPI